MNRIPSLDGFRAISIIMVLFSHFTISAGFPQHLGFLKDGKVGVTVFFVISGFLITTLLLKEEKDNGRINIWQFYTRRAFRILPVFLLYTGFVLAAKNFTTVSFTPGNLLHVLTFTENFDGEYCWILGHFWTLSVEEQFYLFWPLLLIFCRKQIKPLLLIMILYGCMARVIDYKFKAYSAITLSPFFMYADAILVGAFGAIINFNKPDFVKHALFKSGGLRLLALGVFAGFIYLSAHGKLAWISLPFGGLIIALCILYLLLSYITPSKGIVYRLLNSRVMVHIGVLSYSIYIWQQFFIVGDTPVWWRHWPANLIVIYVVALASYYLCEQPVLRLRKNVLKPTQLIG